MLKTCTNSRCRRPFNTALDAYDGRCPYCGKAYPRLPKTERFQGRGYSVLVLAVGQTVRTFHPAVRAILRYDTQHRYDGFQFLDLALPAVLELRLEREDARNLAAEMNASGSVARPRKLRRK